MGLSEAPSNSLVTDVQYCHSSLYFWVVCFFYWTSYRCVPRKTGLILNQVKEIIITRNSWALISTLIKGTYCTGISPLRKAKQRNIRAHKYTHTWAVIFQRRQFILKDEGKWQNNKKNKHFKMFPLKYFVFKYLYVHCECEGSCTVILPVILHCPRSCVTKCSRLHHFLETKQKQRFLQFPQLCFVTEHIYSRSGIGHCIQVLHVLSDKIRYFLRFPIKKGLWQPGIPKDC